MQRFQDSLSFKSLNSDMEVRVRDRRLLRVWIQWSTGFRDFSQISDRSPHVSSDGRSRFFRHFSSPLQRVSGFRASRFHESRGQGFLALWFPGCRNVEASTDSHVSLRWTEKPSAKINGRDLFRMINGHD
jgi:hypothetical protein